MNLASKLQDRDPKVCTSPWTDHEHVGGYVVMVLPFSSGHLLGLRVWLESDFAPYTSVWHRTPEGDWSLYNDGPRLDTTCHRYWGPAAKRSELTHIDVTWTGPNELRVEMENPRLVWTLEITAPRYLQILNAMSAPAPLWTWKPAFLQRLRESMAKRLLGMGDIRSRFITPTGYDSLMMPQELFFIETSEAVLEGQNLGHPVHLEENPTIGGVPMPVRPVFSIIEVHAQIKDQVEYQRTRQQLLGASVS